MSRLDEKVPWWMAGGLVTTYLLRARDTAVETAWRAAGIAATLPPFQQAWRDEVLADSIAATTELEQVYLEAFKAATAAGDRTRGAHIRGLQAVVKLGAPRPPRQSSGDRLRQWIADWLAPRRGP